jgi:dihydropteroate synthase
MTPSIPPSVDAAPSIWRCGRFTFKLDRPLLMGIVNVTPDSFSDGGRFLQFDQALAHAHELIAQGADIVDIGGESTRPGAAEVPVEVELQRVLPLVRALRDARAAVSVDTSRAEVMRAALDEGAAIVNDVRSLTLEGALAAVARRDCGVVLMHMQGTPRTMQADPTYADVVAEVGEFLRGRRDDLVAAGVARERIALDPGFGFGKKGAHNRRLLAELGALAACGQPLLVGLSRKSSLGEITGRPVDERAFASVAAALIAVQNGARIVRVHDVAPTRDVLAVWAAVEQARREPAAPRP